MRAETSRVDLPPADTGRYVSASDDTLAVDLAPLPELPTKAETVQATKPRPGRRVLGWTLNGVWLLLTAAALAAIVTSWLPLGLPGWVATAGAVTITTTYAYGLATRTGGRPVVSGGLALGLSVAAVVAQLPVLLAGIAVATAVLSTLLAVMSTKPAARFSGVVRECLIAIMVAVIGAFAVEAFEAEVSYERMGYLTLGLSLLCALGLVYRLGAGLQGLGKRGTIMIVSGVGLLFVILAYTAALARWGSPGMIEGIDQSIETIRTTIWAVPRPIEVLLGIPALAWGVSTRARRRQGWWVAAFGSAGLSVIVVSLLDPDTPLVESGLSLLYSAVLGLALGYVVIRADIFLTGARGRRARMLEEAAAHRPEPGRMQPLL